VHKASEPALLIGRHRHSAKDKKEFTRKISRRLGNPKISTRCQVGRQFLVDNSDAATFVRPEKISEVSPYLHTILNLIIHSCGRGKITKQEFNGEVARNRGGVLLKE
jgi:hypothetical protein